MAKIEVAKSILDSYNSIDNKIKVSIKWIIRIEKFLKCDNNIKKINGNKNVLNLLACYLKKINLTIWKTLIGEERLKKFVLNYIFKTLLLFALILWMS